MILNLEKNITKNLSDFAIKTEIGEVLFNVIGLKRGGFYFYDKNGQEIAQSVIDKNTAFLSVIHADKTIKDDILITVDKERGISIEVAENTSKTKRPKYNIIDRPAYYLTGNILEYNYKILNFKDIDCVIIPNAVSENHFRIKLTSAENILKSLMIIFSLELLLS